MIELDAQNSEKGQGRESFQSPFVLLHSLVASYRYYAITNTDSHYYIDAVRAEEWSGAKLKRLPIIRLF